MQVIMATNRQDTLDPALLRPGRLDRKIEFPWPSRRERRLIFQTVTGKMNLGPDVDLEDCEYPVLFCVIRVTLRGMGVDESL
jgi:26S proteasome regulatory subunit T3